MKSSFSLFVFELGEGVDPARPEIKVENHTEGRCLPRANVKTCRVSRQGAKLRKWFYFEKSLKTLGPSWE